MARPFLVIIAVASLTLSIAGAAAAQDAPGAPPHSSPTGIVIDPEWVVAVLEPGWSAGDIFDPDDHISGERFVKVRVPPGEQPVEAAAHLALHPGIRIATPNRIFNQPTGLRLASANDPLFSRQWHLVMAQAPDAWDFSRGSGTVVAIIDTGVSLGGEDLDCHSLIDEYDATSHAAGPGVADDTDGHGTHIAGSIGQCTNNGIGAAGMAPEVSIMPIKVFSADAQFGFVTTSFAIAEGIDWARSHGANIINMSLGLGCRGDTYPACSDPAVDIAIEEAVAAGILLVAAAGNSHNAGQPALSYPANHPDVIGVGAVAASQEIPSYSQRGSQLSLVAPGGSLEGPGVLQETIDASGTWGYWELSGTSMAAAHVTGAAAILWSAYPGATAHQVRAALECGVHDLGSPGRDATTGHGLLQTSVALTALSRLVADGVDPCPQTASVGLIDGGDRWHLYTPTGERSFFYGNPGDHPFVGDWDCDGIDTPGVYRPSNGIVYLRNSNTQGIADLEFFVGLSNVVALPGDFDGDGCDTVSVYHPTTALVAIRNHLAPDKGALGLPDYQFITGNPGDTPFVGDFNGDGIDTIGIRRDVSSTIFIRNTNSAGTADVEFVYGNPADRIFAGDWTGNGLDTVGIYRPASTSFFLRYANSAGTASETITVGDGAWWPVAGMFGET
ncbi:MAG: S8 family serine peptidase [Acidimicrobiia bacterium]|nr:S8 family serine peptidase [Acidimicrobiia bacterium]